MMQDIEEEEVHFDQAGLLDNRKKRTKSSLWCRSLIKILCLSLAFLSLGLCIAIPGPTLLDLGERVNTDTSHMALIFSARSLGYLLGAVIGGFLFDIFNKHLLLCSTLFLAALATSIIPWAMTLTVLAVMFSLQGVAMGVLDTGGNALCVRIWGKKSSPYMQAMHFAFGIGAFIAPLLSQPFLSSLPVHNNTIVQGNVPVLTNYNQLLLNNINTVNNKSEERIKRGDVPLNVTLIAKSFMTTPESIKNTLETRSTTVAHKKPIHADDKFSAPDSAAGINFNKKIKEQKKISRTPTPLSKTEKKVTSLLNHTKNENINQTAATVNSSADFSKSEESNESSTSTLNLTRTTFVKDVTTMSELTSTVLLATTMVSTTGEVTATEPTTHTTVPTTTTTSTTTASSITAPPTSTTPTTSPAVPSTTTSPVTTVQRTTTEPTTTSTTTSSATVVKTTPTTPLSTAGSGNKHPSDKSDEGSGKSHSKSHAIVESTTTDYNHSDIETTSSEAATKPPVASDIGNILDAVKHMSKIQFSYMIIAALLAINAIIFLVLYCYDRKTGGVDGIMAEREKHYHIQSSCIRIFILIVMFLFFLSYAGMETTFGGLIMTFTVEYMSWTKEQGAIVTAIFWGSLATGRGISIFIAGCCKPRCMLIVDIILVILGATMLSFVVKAFSFILWMGCLAIGLGMSSIFPTGISWTEQYFRMTGKSTAVLVMGSALGQMIIPVTTGYAFQNVNKMYLMYVVLILSIFCSVLFLIMQILASKCGGNAELRSDNGFLPLANDDGMEMEGLNLGYGTSQGSTRRRLLPNFNDMGYDRLPQDAENEIEDLLS